jgi:hypothetical protein
MSPKRIVKIIALHLIACLALVTNVSVGPQARSSNAIAA